MIDLARSRSRPPAAATSSSCRPRATRRRRSNPPGRSRCDSCAKC